MKTRLATILVAFSVTANAQADDYRSADDCAGYARNAARHDGEFEFDYLGPTLYVHAVF